MKEELKVAKEELDSFKANPLATTVAELKATVLEKEKEIIRLERELKVSKKDTADAVSHMNTQIQIKNEEIKRTKEQLRTLQSQSLDGTYVDSASSSSAPKLPPQQSPLSPIPLHRRIRLSPSPRRRQITPSPRRRLHPPSPHLRLCPASSASFSPLVPRPRTPLSPRNAVEASPSQSAMNAGAEAVRSRVGSAAQNSPHDITAQCNQQ